MEAPNSIEFVSIRSRLPRREPLNLRRPRLPSSKSSKAGNPTTNLRRWPSAGGPHRRRPIDAGIADQIEHLSAKSDSFSLPAFGKWARMLTATKDAKAWSTVFADGHGVFAAEHLVTDDATFAAITGRMAEALQAANTAEVAALDTLRTA